MGAFLGGGGGWGGGPALRADKSQEIVCLKDGEGERSDKERR